MWNYDHVYEHVWSVKNGGNDTPWVKMVRKKIFPELNKSELRFKNTDL